ncbi:MAG: glycosyltransferase [Pseudomonadota bacterium]
MMKRRIIIAGEFWFGSTGAGMAHGLRQQGHIVSEVDMRHHFPVSLNPLSKLAFKISSGQFIASYKQHIRDIVRQGGGDILLTIKGSFLDHSFLSDMRKMGLFIVNFYPDVAFDHPGLSADWLSHYDLIATTKSFHINHLTAAHGADKVAFLPHGYSTLAHRPRAMPADDAPFDYDIAYVGNASAHKAQTLTPIAAAFPHKRFLLAGAGWEQYAQGTALQSCIKLGQVIGDNYARKIERSRINLAVHFGPAGRQGWEDLVSTRSFEIPACGGFMLHVDNEEIRTLFNAGTEIELFSNSAEAIAKIEYYLAHPDQRIAIAQNGYRRCVPAYSLDARAVELMALIEQRIKMRRL